MPELLKTTSSLGKVTIEQLPTGALLVTIKRMGYKKMFSRDKVMSVDSGIGGGSLLGLKTVVIHLAGEKVTLRNVPAKAADEMQRLLS